MRHPTHAFVQSFFRRANLTFHRLRAFALGSKNTLVCGAHTSTASSCGPDSGGAAAILFNFARGNGHTECPAHAALSIQWALAQVNRKNAGAASQRLTTSRQR